MIQKVKKEIEVGKEVSELADGIANIAIKTIEVTADGFQPVTDIPVVALEALKELPAMVGGLDQLDDEFKDSEYDFAMAWGIAGQKVFAAIKARKAAKEAAKVASGN